MYKRTFGIVPRTFGGFFEDAVNSGLNRLNEEVSAYSAPVNIQETDKSYDLHVMAPGLKKEEFKIQLDKQILTISYDHKEETSEENKEIKLIKQIKRIIVLTWAKVGHDGKCEIILITPQKPATVKDYSEFSLKIKCPI